MMNDPVIRGPALRPSALASRAGAQKPRATAFGSLLAEEGATWIGGAGDAVETGAVNPLLLQEIACETADRRDRDARRHANDLLGALAVLQRAGVGLGSDGDARAALEALVAAVPPACDPALASLQLAILLRARVELARAGEPASQD